MYITLLTHTTELNKTSNTGQLVLQQLAQQQSVVCERVIWQRKQPDANLLKRIDSMPSALLYPAPCERSSLSLNEALPKHIILLDATWQQARKMYNHSTYLHGLGHIELTPQHISQYRLRRNQRDYGLCTSESVAELLRLDHKPTLAAQLDAALALKQAQ